MSTATVQSTQGISGMQAFIMPGDITHLAGIVQHLNEQVCAIMLHQHEDVRQLTLPAELPEFLSGKVYSMANLHGLGHGSLSRDDLSCYQGFLDYVFADCRVFYLAQRCSFEGAFNNAILIEQLAHNSMCLVQDTQPRCLIASSAPHSLEAWIFAKCFEYLQIPVFVIESTAIAFRSWICSGLELHQVIPRPEQSTSMELCRSTKRLVEQQSASMPGARDEDGYKISRIYLNSVNDADTNRWWSLKREFAWLFSGRLRGLPFRLHSSLRKRRLFRSYSSHAVTAIPKGPFVVFFAHYQPERSTLPIAFGFVQQWLAIRMLSRTLPAGWTLLVREHPTTWLKPLDVNVRDPKIYDNIAQLDNTSICSMDIDTFELIDRCSAVATLTGSSGFQALIRQKPVLSFGLAPYKNHAACLRITNDEDLVRAFEAIRSETLDAALGDEGLTEYLQWVESNSICEDEDEPDWRVVRLKNFEAIYADVLSGRLILPIDKATTG